MGTGYAKLWTDMFDDEWFISLSCYQRGIWCQLVALAKRKGDSGTIIERKLRLIGDTLAADVRNLRTSLTKMHEEGKIRFTETPKKIVIELLEYEYYQRDKKVGTDLSVTKVQPKRSRKAPLTRPDQRLPDHKKPNPQHGVAVTYFCSVYQEKIGEKYDFKKGHGAIIKRLLTTFEIEKLKKLIDQLFITDDDFTKKMGMSVESLSYNSNKLAQEVSKRRKMQIYNLHERLERKPTEGEIAELFGEAPPNNPIMTAQEEAKHYKRRAE